MIRYINFKAISTHKILYSFECWVQIYSVRIQSIFRNHDYDDSNAIFDISVPFENKKH